MSDKLTIENPLDWRSRALLAESEEERLRAEIEHLKGLLAQERQLTLNALDYAKERDAEIERLREENDEQRFEIERLIEDRDRPEVLPEQGQRISQNQLKMIDDLR